MAKTTKARPTAKGVKKGPSSKGKASKSRKAPVKAPKRPASKAGKSKARPRSAKASTRVEKSAMPKQAASVAAARRAVARPTKAHHEAQMEQAEHDHQDPRLAGIPGVSHEGDKVQVENYGQFKNKAVARLDKPTNWFRRAAKPKS